MAEGPIAGMLRRRDVLHVADFALVAESLRQLRAGALRFSQFPHTILAQVDSGSNQDMGTVPDAGVGWAAIGQGVADIDWSFYLRPDEEVLANSSAARNWLAALGLALNTVRGGFAFAVYDMRRETLVLARDPIGIKPLFFGQFGDRLVFGSRLWSVTAAQPRGFALEEEPLGEYLQSGLSSDSRTLVRGIQRVLPGEMVVIGPNFEVRRTLYWGLGERQAKRPYDRGAAESILGRLLASAATGRDGDGRDTGLLLSGGVDSAALLATLRDMGLSRIKTFSMGYVPSLAHCELGRAAHLAQCAGVKHITLRLDRGIALQRIPHVVWASDEPILDFASVPLSFLSEAASQHCGRLMTGDGGDEVFGGDRLYRRSRWYRWLRHLQHPEGGGFRCKGIWDDHWLDAVFAPNIASAGRVWRQPLIARWDAAPSWFSFLQKSQWTDIRMALPNQYAVKVERQASAFGLEVGLPFMDPRVVEFGLALPDHEKVRGGQGKLLLKHWTQHRLDNYAFPQRKQGFSVPSGHWLSGLPRERLLPALLKSPVIQSLCQPEGIRALLQAWEGGAPVGKQIWQLILLCLWANVHLERRTGIPGLAEDLLTFLSG